MIWEGIQNLLDNGLFTEPVHLSDRIEISLILNRMGMAEVEQLDLTYLFCCSNGYRKISIILLHIYLVTYIHPHPTPLPSRDCVTIRRCPSTHSEPVLSLSKGRTA